MGEIEHPLPLLNCDESGFVLWESIAVQRVADAEPQMREKVVRQFGKRGLIALSFAILAARMYPTLKYALGHGRACTRLAIGGEKVPVLCDTTQSMPRASAA